jgi:hypothetical protein
MSLRDKLKEIQDAERRAADQRRIELELYERSVNQTRDAEFLRRELAGHLISSRSLAKQWTHRLAEVRRLGYDHKEDYAQRMVIKYSALQLQALCGLATLASLSGADKTERIDIPSVNGSPSGRGRGNGPRK